MPLIPGTTKRVLSAVNYAAPAKGSGLLLRGATSGSSGMIAAAAGPTIKYTLPASAPASDGESLTSTIAGVMSWAVSGGSPANNDGAVQFNDNGSFGGDSANFFWDDVNKRLGIKTNSPNEVLSVGGNIEIGSGLGATSPVITTQDDDQAYLTIQSHGRAFASTGDEVHLQLLGGTNSDSYRAFVIEGDRDGTGGIDRTLMSVYWGGIIEGAIFRLTNNSGRMFAGGGNLNFDNEGGGGINFSSSGSVKMNVASTGGVAIGTGGAGDGTLAVQSVSPNSNVLLLKGAASQVQPLLRMVDSSDNDFVNFGKGLAGSTIVFNEQGADIDFRVESDNAANLLFLDAGLDTGAGGIGFFGTAAQIQQATIVDADGTLADVTNKLNTLLADLEGYGLLKSA